MTRGRGYELQLPDDDVDAVRFEHLVEERRAREALALWRGEPLADVADEPFAAAEIRRLEDLRLRAAEMAIDADLEAGRHAEVIGELDALVAQHPLRERLHSRRMLALYRSGRQSEALEAYREARSALVEEIGVEPGAELRRLHDAILAQDPALDLQAPATRRRARGRGRAGAAAAGCSSPPPPWWSRVSPRTASSASLEPDGVRASARTRSAGSTRTAAASRRAIGVGPEPRRGGGRRGLGVGRQPARRHRLADRPRGVAGRGRHDPGRRRALRPRLRSGLAVGGRRGRARRSPRSTRARTRSCSGSRSATPRARWRPTAGALWAVSGVDGSVHRIDLDSARVTRSIPIGAVPTAIVAGAGALWVSSEESGTVTRIDPRSGAVVQAITVGNGPSALAVGEGAVWVVNRHDGTLSRIDPARNVVSGTEEIGGEPTAVAAGGGTVWVAGGEGGTVARVDPEGPTLIEKIKTGSSPIALAVSGGSLWTAAAAPQAAHRGGTLRVLASVHDERLPIDWLDGAGYATTTIQLTSLAYDGLVGYRRVGGAGGATLVGALATSAPARSRDGRTYVFTLRPGVRYSDGRLVQPEDFRASMERSLRIAIRTCSRGTSPAVVGASPSAHGRAATSRGGSRPIGARAPSPST